MANNENVNKVIFGDQTVMDITDTTATEGDVVSGKTFYKASGERATGNVVIPDISNCYQTTDSTLSSIADEDYFPFLASQNIGKKKVSWAYIKTRLKVYFDSFYAAFTNTEAELRDTVGWVCKNKLDITLTYLKSINTAGTWSGNAYTHNGVTYTCSFNSEGYLSGITTSGTSSGASQLKILYGTYSSFSPKYPQGSYYKFNGCPSGGASSGGFKMFFGIGSIATHDITSNVDYTFEIPTVGVYSGDYLTYSIEVASGVSMASKTFKPMIRDEANGSSVYESYHKNVKSYVDESVSPKVSESLLKNTVGWVGKNLLNPTSLRATRTYANVTMTNNSDGTITANGTANATANIDITQQLTLPNGRYKFSVSETNISGLRVGGNGGVEIISSISTGANEVEFEASSSYTYYILQFVVKNTIAYDVTIHPMLRSASVTDSTYEPYHESVEEVIEQVYADNGILGAKNILDFYKLSSSDISIVSNATYALSDNTYDISIPSSYDSASGIYFKASSLRTQLTEFSGISGILTLLIKGSEGGTVKVGDDSSPLTNITTSWQEFSLFVSDISQIPNILVYARSQTLKSGHIFVKDLMLRLATDTDSTYQPYAMTNRELTEKVFEKGVLTSSDDLDDIKETGIYSATTSPTHSPDSLQYFTLIVKKRDNTDIKQMIFMAGFIYTRRYGGSPLSWGSWYKFSGTVVS